MKKIITIMIIGLFLTGGLAAQGMMYGGPGGPRPGDRGNKEHCISDEPYYQYMVFRMTEVLELTPEQAEKLFPLNRPYRDNKHALHIEMKELSQEVFKNTEITKADLQKYKDKISQLRKEEDKLDDQFYSEVEKFLEPAQVAKLIFFDAHFRGELSKELKERYNPEQKKKVKNKFWNKRK